MSALCTEALNQCINSAHLTQALLEQCNALSTEHAPHAESHIAHATAVFCELGLAISSASLADPLAWRRTAGPIKDNQDVIEKANFLSVAKQRGWFSYAVNWLLEVEIKNIFIVRLFIIYALPSICWIATIFVLFGISFPNIFGDHSEIFNDHQYFAIAFLAFIFSFIAAYVTKKQFEISGGVNVRLDEPDQISIDP